MTPAPDRLAPACIALVVTGSVAAVKTFILMDALRAQGFDLRVVVTEAAWPFLTAEGKYRASEQEIARLKNTALTYCHSAFFPLPPHLRAGEGQGEGGLSVKCDQWSQRPASPPPSPRPSPAREVRGEREELGIFGDVKAILIAPASADFIRQVARGGTPLGDAIKNSGKPVLLAPAMNFMMWQHPAVQENLKRTGAVILGPDYGDMACGDKGFGRLSDPALIAEATAAVLRGESHALVEAGKKALVGNPALPSRTRKPCRRILWVIQEASDDIVPSIRRFLKDGYDIQCVISPEAAEKMDIAELQRLTAHIVCSAHHQIYPKDGMEHIWLPEDSDVVVMQPVAKKYLDEMTVGAAESFIGCIYLASKRPVIIIPGGRDVSALAAHGAVITDISGLARAMESLEQDAPSGFEEKSFLVLGGRAKEAVDSFRFYANTSRPADHGEQVAEELRGRGAEVTFISADGSTADLLKAVPEGKFEAVIQLASIPQFTCPNPTAHKIAKKDSESARLFNVAGNVDVLAELRRKFGADKIMGYDNFQTWTAEALSPLKHKIASLVRRAPAPSPALEREREGARPCGKGEGLSQTESESAGQALSLPPQARAAGPSLSRSRAGEGKARVIVTNGPTEEKLTADGVVVTNRSTGTQGREIARAFVERGAEVVVVSGPVALPDAEGARTVHVTSMRGMQDAVLRELETHADVYISVAAIADFSLPEPLSLRLKPGETYKLEMQENPSLAAMVTRHKNRPTCVVSFAAQSPDGLVAYATEKFKALGADMTVANPIGDGAATTRDSGRNEVCLIYRRDGEVVTEKLAEMGKAEVADKIMGKVLSIM